MLLHLPHMLLLLDSCTLTTSGPTNVIFAKFEDTRNEIFGGYGEYE